VPAKARRTPHLPGRLRPCARKAGLPPQFIPHSLRHYLASTALARGIPITDVSEWLGHRSIEVTYRIYRNQMPSAWDRARAALDQAYMDAVAGGRPDLGPRGTAYGARSCPIEGDWPWRQDR
jgi:integrase